MGEGVPDEVRGALTDLAITVLLYYEDAYLKEFEATVLKTMEFKDRFYIVLDQTCFFPEGGGQPSDKGFIHGSKGKVRVTDVQSSNGVIVHTIENSKEAISAGETVHGVIDWDLRYNYMRQHTASHIVHNPRKQRRNSKNCPSGGT
ncbi:MAG: alanyl-tRNA editing protein [Candidatus Bathyarchaeia archaeon]